MPLGSEVQRPMAEHETIQSAHHTRRLHIPEASSGEESRSSGQQPYWRHTETDQSRWRHFRSGRGNHSRGGGRRSALKYFMIGRQAPGDLLHEKARAWICRRCRPPPTSLSLSAPLPPPPPPANYTHLWTVSHAKLRPWPSALLLRHQGCVWWAQHEGAGNPLPPSLAGLLIKTLTDSWHS